MEEVLRIHSPATGELLAEVPALGPADVTRAAERARRAQAAWARTPPRERAQRLGRAIPRLLEHKDALVELAVRESGKPRAEALSMELLPLLELLHWASAEGPAVLEDRPLKARVAPHKRSLVTARPRGTVALLAPYNFPVAIGVGEAVLALLAGNAVLLKPSEMTPLITQAVAGHLRDAADLDDGLLAVLTGGPATGAALLAADVDYLAFTGSAATGRRIGAACGERGLPCRLELGGKADVVVCADADLGRTAAALTWGAFVNGGQVCAGVQRVYVVRSRLDDLAARVADEVGALRAGDPLKPGTDLGFLCPAALPGRVRELVDDARGRGGRLLVGDRLPEADDRRVRPTVVVDPPPEARLLREECFGPAVALVGVRDDDEALARANAGPGDLISYVFTDDRARAERLAGHLRAGTVMVNDVVWAYGMPEAPWAAVSRSGVGVAHGEAGLLDYTTPRHLCFERARVLERDPYWYPYSASRVQNLSRGLHALYGKGMGKLRGLFG